ncbi:ABC-three component system middle component 6 [Halomonas llamarensis]|uniref:Uncharacterized protein n=1 Tax=Halomonas llamarensis TaxID=2945104 RepID=A0ABT0SV69_9GAMM|nr:ABC-three component system middle component 6 [Halomonas llamarensis]MCL7931536.1 hypothetical protein [Halomonas llamarensis]
MLLPDNIHPDNSVYYNGAIVLQVLQNNGNMELFELYEQAKSVKAMSFPLFVLCLDWLYLIDAAILNSGEVQPCS